MKTKTVIVTETERQCSAPFVSRRIRRLKLSRPMTSTEFAAKAGIARPIMSQIENGLYVPTHRVAARLIDTYNVDWNYIYGGSTEMLPRAVATAIEGVTEQMIDDDIAANNPRRKRPAAKEVKIKKGGGKRKRG